MNKSTNNYRRCAFCPHHGQENKCCCKKQKKRAISQKRNTNISKMLKNHNTSDFINYSQLNKFSEINMPTLMAENSFLKSANLELRNDLLSVSECIKQNKIPFRQHLVTATSNNYKSESQQMLIDKLYLSNKNLQEAVLKIDSLSRINKELMQKNIHIETQVSTYKFQNSALLEEIENMKKKLKASQISLNQSQIHYSIKEDHKLLKQKYESLKIENGDLTHQVSKLHGYLKAKRNQECLSPQWIAETSNKLAYIEQRIDNVDQNSTFPQNNDISYEKISTNLNYFSLIHKLKEQLALSINIIHSKTRKYISVFDSIGNVENINITNLICCLFQGLMENCVNLTYTVQNQLNRKVSSVEKRLEHLLEKLQNFLLQIKNRQLRKRSTSRRKILGNINPNLIQNTYSKGSFQCKSPLINKQNVYVTNRNDKTC